MFSRSAFPPIASLRAFEAVGRLGGIRKASKEINTDHGAVSRHIRSLESWLGAKLLVRDGQGYQLTETGAAYHQEIAKAIHLIGSATSGIMQPQERLSLSIWCIPGFGSLWLSDRLGDFIASNPDVDLDFRPADQSPDFRSVLVDGDIRYLRYWEEADVPKHVRVLEFARPEVFPVASPEYAANMKPIEDAREFLDHTLLHEDTDAEWRHWLLPQGVEADGALPGPRLWHAHLTINAARQSRGIALANIDLLSNDLETGRLVRIHPVGAPFQTVAFGGYCLLGRSDRWNSPALARFRKWIREKAAA
ncbi:LysR substrate-binding domain-containing protein [Novosphingobium beihaiensis]|uniref:LysR substrate-binding domain-containing protein n=1 Tax=Novosphingobium beihaiensis TaxID=2930389 RepID=A0ABT0BL99_9SPHN|nr:LysR substrate-binding domain-containing protein [Novosphingobium beihaiensis]MCJ2185825.1 LysR substrate-binding domain-containing protein [Novosphingobium beihaiensis]